MENIILYYVLILYKDTREDGSEKKKPIKFVTRWHRTDCFHMHRRYIMYIILCILVYYILIFHQGPSVVAEVACLSPDNNELMFYEINIIIVTIIAHESGKSETILIKYYNQSSELDVASTHYFWVMSSYVFLTSVTKSWNYEFRT